MIVYAQRSDRLGGRLCAIVNGMRLARVLNAEFRFGWPADEYHFENLDDVQRLLSAEFIATYQISAEQRRGLDLVRFDLFDPAAPPPQGIEVNTPAGIALLPGESEATAARQCRDIFAASTMIAPHILATVDALAEKFGLNDGSVTALHVRRGDVVTRYRVDIANPEFFPRYVPMQYYLDWAAKARSAGAAGRLVVFSEDGDVREALSSRLPDTRACDTPTEAADLSPLETALVEMLLMARCTRIVGGYSAFNNFPCLIGTPHKVSIRDVLTPDERLSALVKAAKGSDLIGNEPDFVSVLLLEESVRAGRPGAVEDFIDRCQGNINILATGGALLQAEGFSAEAVRLLRGALTGKPLLATAAWNNLARALVALGRTDEALEAVDNGLTLQANRWDLLCTRGAVLIAAGARAEGLSHFRQAVAVAPAYVRAAACAALADAEAAANVKTPADAG